MSRCVMRPAISWQIVSITEMYVVVYKAATICVIETARKPHVQEYVQMQKVKDVLELLPTV